MFFMIIENAKDKPKIERLYAQYGKLMYKVAYGFLNDRHLAEDAVQQAFVRIINNLHKIDENNCRKTRNFLVIICRNAAVDIYNERRKIDTTEIYDDINSNEDSPPDILINEESLEHLSNLICSLKPIYQDVLLLRFSQDYSVAEIAELLNIDTKTVQKRIERAKEKLRKLL